MMHKSKPLAYKSILFLGIGLFLAFFGIIFFILRNNIIDVKGTGKQKAEIIIKALYTYKANHGDYPSQLEELVPDYLEKIPHAAFGQTFFYRSNDVDGFFIGFKISPNFGCGYTAKYKTWECSFGAE
jgi:hypothetical protein